MPITTDLLYFISGGRLGFKSFKGPVKILSHSHPPKERLGSGPAPSCPKKPLYSEHAEVRVYCKTQQKVENRLSAVCTHLSPLLPSVPEKTSERLESIVSDSENGSQFICKLQTVYLCFLLSSATEKQLLSTHTNV